MRFQAGGGKYVVVEIWVESATSVEAPATWRERVTHGPSGERWVVRSVEELTGVVG